MTKPKKRTMCERCSFVAIDDSCLFEICTLGSRCYYQSISSEEVY